MIKFLFFFSCILIISCAGYHSDEDPEIAVIRINQLGYQPESVKAAVFGSATKTVVESFSLHHAATGESVLVSNNPVAKGSYGPFKSTYRLNFSEFKISGTYYIQAADVRSPVFRINANVYDHTADFLLNYMRQQRCGYNPYLVDSCHLDDGYILYNPSKEGQRIDVTGGWHDATDYLQYTATSANAVFQLLLSCRENPSAFGDLYQANGLPGPNGIPDIIDEAKWGMDWLKKMNPSPKEFYNQIADDRDHVGFRLPNKDSAVYDPGRQGRPVYLASGEKQGMMKHKNRSTGAASTAGKYASAFALGAEVLKEFYPEYTNDLTRRAKEAFYFGEQNPGVSQTAPGRAPYFYEEDNWVDDMELAAACLYRLTGEESYKEKALYFAAKEKITPWIGKDTARHYQFYPFMNVGHHELAAALDSAESKTIISYYDEGLNLLYERGKKNAFFIGAPFIWCSNNYVTASLTQCLLYNKLTGDDTYAEMEAGLRDWLFGCNIWGTSMVVGLPEWGVTPSDPHSSLNFLEGYQTYGGLVDGPVYGSIAGNLIGVVLNNQDEYADFQSDLAVYQDDVGSFSTNEPTMDGTACLVYYLSALESTSIEKGHVKKKFTYDRNGAIIRGDIVEKKINLMFSGDEFADGADIILEVLGKHGIKASFFLTGNFYRNKEFSNFIRQAKIQGHYLGAHSDKHLLYNDWTPDKKLLISREEFKSDLKANYAEMKKFGIEKGDAPYFLPPYEWHNEIVTQWANQMDIRVINYTPGSLTHADYTIPSAENYRSNNEIMQSVLSLEQKEGLNGFLLLSHVGTHPDRTDKFYTNLDGLISDLKKKGYRFEPLNSILDLKE